MALMTDREAVVAVQAAFPDAHFVVANGYLSREAFDADDRERAFYMLGSMGLGPSIGLGLALARPDKKVLVLDGDGNLLMALGALALVGAQQPKNLFHVCVDNGVYASTGNQPTVAPHVQFDAVAKAAGYVHTASVEDPAEVEGALAALAAAEGPAFLRIRVGVQAKHPRDLPRVNHTCPEIVARFQASLGPRPGAGATS
jgi:thiamine pyrophosphate-dependent acetolactate synthase large subunit-like protein